MGSLQLHAQFLQQHKSENYGIGFQSALLSKFSKNFYRLGHGK